MTKKKPERQRYGTRITVDAPAVQEQPKPKAEPKAEKKADA